MKLIEFINTYVSDPFRICQRFYGRPSTISIIYNSVAELPDGIADKLTVSNIVPANSCKGPIIHIWCYDKEDMQ